MALDVTKPGLCVFAIISLFTYRASAYDVVAVGNGGTVSGHVTFTGTVPTRQIIPTKDLDTCGGPREDALLEVGPSHGVANTLVYLADIEKGKSWPAPSRPPELDNRKCRFEPEMQVIQPGSIAVVNKDPVLHNTHGYYGRRTAFNTALPNQNQSIAQDRHRACRLRCAWLDGRLDLRARQSVLCRHGQGRKILNRRRAARHLQTRYPATLFGIGRAAGSGYRRQIHRSQYRTHAAGRLAGGADIRPARITPAEHTRHAGDFA